MGIYQVTQGQWKSVMATEPWSGQSVVDDNVKCAATYISWEDAIEFCKKLSTREGRTYRLPTEAEWEYACRAGTTAAYSFGHIDNIRVFAWFSENAGRIGAKYAHEVGLLRPNDWGLCDMHGNVWEWCQDWMTTDYYAASPEDNPGGPSSGSGRVCRGGSWDDPAVFCR